MLKAIAMHLVKVYMAKLKLESQCYPKLIHVRINDSHNNVDKDGEVNLGNILSQAFFCVIGMHICITSDFDFT